MSYDYKMALNLQSLFNSTGLTFSKSQKPVIKPNTSLVSPLTTTPQTPSYNWNTPLTASSMSPVGGNSMSTTSMAVPPNTSQKPITSPTMPSFGSSPVNMGSFVNPGLTFNSFSPSPTLHPNITTPSGVTVNPNTGGVATPQAPQNSGYGIKAPPGMEYDGKGNLVPIPQQNTNTTVPTAPTVPDPYQTAVTDAEKAYQSNLALTPEEEAAQKDLSSLEESYKTGFLNTNDQTIPLEFITGQQASMEKRKLALSEPLQDKLARIQAKRQSALEASKFSLERADKALENKRSSETEASTLAEKKREFDSTQEQSKNQFDLNYKLSKDKFDQDTKQFGMQYALDKQKLAIEQAKATGDPAGATALRDNALTSAKALLTKFKSGQGTSAVGKSGAFNSFGYGLIPGTQRADFIVQYNNLKSLLSLENIKYLKGQGQVSDAERRLLEQASAKLNTSQSEAEFEQSLQDVISSFGTASSVSANDAYLKSLGF